MADQEFTERGLGPDFYPSQIHLGLWEHCISSPRGVWGQATAANDIDALQNNACNIFVWHESLFSKTYMIVQI